VGTRESLHALIDELTDEEADELLKLVLTDLGPSEPLSDADIASIRKGLEDARSGRTITTDELLQRISHN
jgi:predicted transcriptional regulator